MAFKKPWRAKSWDRFCVPRPFSPAACVVPEAVIVPHDADRDTIEAAARKSKSACMQPRSKPKPGCKNFEEEGKQLLKLSLPANCDSSIFRFPVESPVILARSARIVRTDGGTPMSRRRSSSIAGLADSLFICGCGGLSGGASRRCEKTGAGPARDSAAHSAWPAALCLPHCDGTAVPDLRHDDLVCVVGTRADRAFLASQ